MVQKQMSRGSRPNDLLVFWTDSDGQKWNIEFQLKTVGNIARIHAFQIRGTTPDARLTANQLSEEFLALAQRFLPKKKSETLPGSAGGQRATSKAELRLVADLYEQAVSQRVDTQKYVAKGLNVSSPTAARRIRAARDIGLLEVKKTKTHKQGAKKK